MDSRGGHNKYPYNKVFFKHWSNKMAYVLGFLFADGNITDARRSSRTQYVKFTSKDRVIIEKIKRALSSRHQIQIRKPTLNKYPNGQIYRSSQIYNLRIGSQELFSDLIARGVVPNKSLVAKFPVIPRKYINHFIRGYFDGDGCVYIERKIGKAGQILIRSMRVIFTSGSEQFLKGLEEMLKKYVGMVNGQIYYEHRAFRLVYMTRESKLFYEFIYKNKDDLFLSRKYDIFENFRKVRQIGTLVVK